MVDYPRSVTNGRCVSLKFRLDQTYGFRIVRFLVRDALVRTKRRALEMMFVRLFVRPSWTDMHCDHTVHLSGDLS